MRKLILSSSLAISLLGSLNAVQAEGILTGDTRLACEAILCLSSGSRPSECNASIRKYFSITNKKPHKTIQQRKDFLSLCPSSSEQGMPALVSAIANGAGRCDANELNQLNRKTVTYYVWQRHKDMGDGYVRKSVKVIGNSVPSYCAAYASHEWTDGVLKARYEGDLWPYPDGHKFPRRGAVPSLNSTGRWVDN